MDLTPNGMTLPLLVAAAVAGALHWYTNRKPAAAPTPGPGTPATEAGPLDWLSGLLSKSKQLSALVPILLAIWKNHEAILTAVQNFITSVKQMMSPPATPTKGA